ncbi:MAG: hypothetical protein B1H03_00250 [Planctomycetales bacterium 4484_113]|nr:MAG: hypothetical protein B1H03_00250 [Planctomycetales bacterium 4484_113]
MKPTILFVAVSLALSLTACGGGHVSPPPNQPSLSGVYEGTITASDGVLNARLVVGDAFSDGSFPAELSSPGDPQVVPVEGVGSQWGSSFSVVFDRFSQDPFYLEGRLDAATGRLAGTIRYADRRQTLSFVFFYAGTV